MQSSEINSTFRSSLDAENTERYLNLKKITLS